MDKGKDPPLSELPPPPATCAWAPGVRRLATGPLPLMTAVIAERSSRPSNTSRSGRRRRGTRRPIGLLPESLAPRLGTAPVRFDGIRRSASERSGHDPLSDGRVDPEHAATVADRRVEVLFDDLVEVE